LKKIERPIYMRNVDSSFNKKGPIKHTIEVNIYYQIHKKRTEIDVIEIGEVNMIRCQEECGKQ